MSDFGRAACLIPQALAVAAKLLIVLGRLILGNNIRFVGHAGKFHPRDSQCRSTQAPGPRNHRRTGPGRMCVPDRTGAHGNEIHLFLQPGGGGARAWRNSGRSGDHHAAARTKTCAEQGAGTCFCPLCRPRTAKPGNHFSTPRSYARRACWRSSPRSRTLTASFCGMRC